MDSRGTRRTRYAAQYQKATANAHDARIVGACASQRSPARHSVHQRATAFTSAPKRAPARHSVHQCATAFTSAPQRSPALSSTHLCWRCRAAPPGSSSCSSRACPRWTSASRSRRPGSRSAATAGPSTARRSCRGTCECSVLQTQAVALVIFESGPLDSVACAHNQNVRGCVLVCACGCVL